MKSIFLFFATLFIFISCGKKDEGDLIKNQAGTIQLSSNSSCNSYIQLDSGQKIDPVNEEKTDGFLIQGKRVTVSYRVKNDFVTACTGATPVLLEDIR